MHCKLKFDGVLSIGTVRSNQTAGYTLENDKTLKIKGRGQFDYSVDTENDMLLQNGLIRSCPCYLYLITKNLLWSTMWIDGL